jgi:hypothetical protein
LQALDRARAVAPFQGDQVAEIPLLRLESSSVQYGATLRYQT